MYTHIYSGRGVEKSFARLIHIVSGPFSHVRVFSLPPRLHSAFIASRRCGGVGGRLFISTALAPGAKCEWLLWTWPDRQTAAERLHCKQTHVVMANTNSPPRSSRRFFFYRALHFRDLLPTRYRYSSVNRDDTEVRGRVRPTCTVFSRGSSFQDEFVHPFSLGFNFRRRDRQRGEWKKVRKSSRVSKVGHVPVSSRRKCGRKPEQSLKGQWSVAPRHRWRTNEDERAYGIRAIIQSRRWKETMR